MIPALCSNDLTYAFAVLEEGKRAMPGVQMHTDDGALAES